MKGELIQTKHTLSLARQGYDILDQKRQVLQQEAASLRGQAQSAQARLSEALAAAEAALSQANTRMGTERVKAAARTVPTETAVRISTRHVMAVEIPQAEYTAPPPTAPPYGLHGTSITLDEAYTRFCEVKKQIISLAALENTIHRLESAIKKTHKRANALQYIIIPRCEARLRFIQSALEEHERDGFVRQKLGKKAALW